MDEDMDLMRAVIAWRSLWDCVVPAQVLPAFTFLPKLWKNTELCKGRARTNSKGVAGVEDRELRGLRKEWRSRGANQPGRKAGASGFQTARHSAVSDLEEVL